MWLLWTSSCRSRFGISCNDKWIEVIARNFIVVGTRAPNFIANSKCKARSNRFRTKFQPAIHPAAVVKIHEILRWKWQRSVIDCSWNNDLTFYVWHNRWLMTSSTSLTRFKQNESNQNCKIWCVHCAKYLQLFDDIPIHCNDMGRMVGRSHCH